MRSLFLAFLCLAASAAAPPVKDVKLFYVQNCAGCHGQDGSARAVDGAKLSGQDFTSPRWQKHTRDEEMVDAVLTGRHAFFGPSMPAFADRIGEADALRLAQEVLRKVEKGKPVKPD